MENRFGRVTDYAAVRQQIHDVALTLRGLRPSLECTWREPADHVVKDANMHGETVVSLTITLTPFGCEWAATGGCTMCGEYEGSTKGRALSPEFHVAQFAAAVGRYAAAHYPAWLRIYQEGNFANRAEVDRDAQISILRLAGVIRGVRRVTIECMAKYVVRDHFLDLRDALDPSVELEVGMGFEAEDDVIRNVCVCKGETIAEFEQAVRTLKNCGVRSLAYVLLKPPFVTEGEAIDEATATIRRAASFGFDGISLEPASIHAYSVVDALYRAGCYTPPWLWSVLEVARASKGIADFRIGGTGFFPRPKNLAFNRHEADDGCNDRFWNAIRDYGATRDMATLEAIDCQCRSAWRKVLEQEAEPLQTRIEHQLSTLDLNRYATTVRG